jgi:hypothetical protein
MSENAAEDFLDILKGRPFLEPFRSRPCLRSIVFNQTDQSSRANIHSFAFPNFCLAKSLSKLAG